MSAARILPLAFAFVAPGASAVAALAHLADDLRSRLAAARIE
jgi:hypothetical protein